MREADGGTDRPGVTVAVLAGGRSRRMGLDKANLVVAGRTMLAAVAGAAVETGRPVLVVGRQRPPDWPLDEVGFLPDEQPGEGPLGGLVTVLRRTGGEVLALACDLPQLTVDGLDWLLVEAARRVSPDGLATIIDGRLEPLFAVYAPTALPLAEANLAAGERSLLRLIADARFDLVEAPDWLRPQLHNVNTPDDL